MLSGASPARTTPVARVPCCRPAPRPPRGRGLVSKKQPPGSWLGVVRLRSLPADGGARALRCVPPRLARPREEPVRIGFGLVRGSVEIDRAVPLLVPGHYCPYQRRSKPLSTSKRLPVSIYINHTSLMLAVP
jgi:hypothetical protein